MALRAIRRAAASLAILAIAGTCAHATERNASWLLSSCQRLLNSRPIDGYRVPDDRNTGECAGTLVAVWQLGGVYDIGSPVRSVLGRSVLGICAAENEASPVQLAQIFYMYMQQHPERLGIDAAFAVMEALRHSYPCK